MPNGFTWEASPAEVWGEGIDAWDLKLYDGLQATFKQGADDATRFMQQNAPWLDSLDGLVRQGLYAYNWQVGAEEMGITAAYSRVVDSRGQVFLGFEHELTDFPYAGIISIILNRREPTFLGEFSIDFMDRVRVLVGDKPWLY